MFNTVKNCPICGKPIPGSFLGLISSACTLDLGADMQLPCCEDCFRKFHPFLKEDNGRLGIKISNMKLMAQLPQVSVGRMAADLLRYYEEAQEYQRKNIGQCHSRHFVYGLDPANADEHVLFHTAEADLREQNAPMVMVTIRNDLANRDELWSNKCKGIGQQQKPWGFTREDLSHLQYAYVPVGEDYLSDQLNNYVVLVELNNPLVISYKPAFINGIVRYDAGFTKEGARLDQLVTTAVEGLAKDLGDLPITRVR